MKITFTLTLLFIALSLNSQSFPPAAWQPGTTAISKDSNVFIDWASGIDLNRGYLDRSDTNFQIAGSNRASFGVPMNGTGPAEGNSIDVVSLGDEGEAILTFSSPIVDGPGWDFAVFENSFSPTFLELAHVEVSSDGINFVRFPSTSETQTTTQVGGFGSLDASYLSNLAGKYAQGFGTPFDLNELAGNSLLDLNSITHVKLVDVVGSINNEFGTQDAFGTFINDPFPTPFESGGFDLDGVGVIHNQEEFASLQEGEILKVNIYPNPSVGQFYFQKINSSPVMLQIFDQTGRMHVQEHLVEDKVLLDYQLNPGVYILRVSNGLLVNSVKLIISK